MGAELEGITYQLKGKRQLISLPYFHGTSHVSQFSYCKVKGSKWMILLGSSSEKEKEKGTGDGKCGRDMIQNKETVL